jgi:hypothetical protein
MNFRSFGYEASTIQSNTWGIRDEEVIKELRLLLVWNTILLDKSEDWLEFEIDHGLDFVYDTLH